MSCCDGNDPACPCGKFVHPAVITNQPGLSTLAARSGDYVAYRRALLQALPEENELSRQDGGTRTLLWRPTAAGDLALQMVEWWAYLADILTFYNERVSNESYLRTAQLPESLNRLIGLLGYRPRPALGARGTLAALMNRNRAVTVPQGLQIQSKPGPGEQPQIFEVDTDTTAIQPDALTAVATPQPPASFFSSATGGTTSSGSTGSTATLLVSGRIGGLNIGDPILLVKAGWSGTSADYAYGHLATLTPGTAPDGSRYTAISFTVASQASGDFSATDAKNWRLLKSNGTATLYPYLSDTTLTSASTNPNTVNLHLASIFRQIAAGSLVVVDDSGAASVNVPYLGVVTAYAEQIYYANNPSSPAVPPTDPSPAANVIPIPILHSVITLKTPSSITGDAGTVVIRYGWKDIGTLIDPPATSVAGNGAGTGGTASATAASGLTVTGAPINANALVDDVNLDGASASTDGNGVLTLDPSAPTLTPPLRALFNLVPVSRGKSVLGEILGSGDGTVLSQDFQLQNAPVTYFADVAGNSGAGFSSTVKVRVNGVLWQEVPSFFGQSANAQVFMTREDDAANTHVVFGDGVCGARLPTGLNNVVANYRYGAGADTPASGTLVSILKSQPGLASVVNPVVPAGGADADPPAKIRQLAPQSVLTFGRAVSLDDYQTLAAGAGGVLAAQASYTFDVESQRPSVHVWVAGDAGAASAAQSAIAQAADPNRAFKVEAATALTVALSLSYVRDPRYQDGVVKQGIHDALLDPDSGLFGSNRVQIGHALFDSDIYGACLSVPGVTAIHSLFLAIPQLGFKGDESTPACGQERHDPGDGCYFVLPDDPAHLAFNAESP